MNQKKINISWLDFKSNTCPQRLLKSYPGIGSRKIKKGDSVKVGLYRTQGKRIKTICFWSIVTEVSKSEEIQIQIDEDLSSEWDCRKGQLLKARPSAILDAV